VRREVVLWPAAGAAAAVSVRSSVRPACDVPTVWSAAAFETTHRPRSKRRAASRYEHTQRARQR